MKLIPVETYDRCVGYFSPITQTNKGKREEISMRLRYNISKLEIEDETKSC